MLTCFINPNYSYQENTFGYKSIFWILLLMFLCIPAFIFLYACAQVLIIIRHIKLQKDAETNSIFLKYSMHLGIYIILTLLITILYVWDTFSTNDNLTDGFKKYSYVVTLCSMFIPVVAGLIQFGQIYLNNEDICCNSFKKLNQSVSDIESGILLSEFIAQQEEEDGSLERLEEKSMKKVSIYMFIHIIL